MRPSARFPPPPNSQRGRGRPARPRPRLPLRQNRPIAFVQHRHVGIRSLDDVRAWPGRLATFSPEVEEERRAAKRFLYKNLYFSTALDPEKDDAERVIRELFDFWMTKPENLPHNYQEKAESESLPRVVCDYIAGMTDNFIYEQYAKYCGGS